MMLEKGSNVCSCLPAAQIVCQDPEAGWLRVAAQDRVKRLSKILQNRKDHRM